MFEGMIEWCKYKDYPWKIINEYFYWQTNYQTGRQDKEGHVIWGDIDWFTKV